MQRGLWASLRSFRGIKRYGFTRLISSALNNTRTDLTKFKMHKGGIRNQSEFSRGGGRRGGRGHHPSGLSGKQIGLWYAAKGKRNRKDRELKQRAYVTMESHHEEKITELLGKIRADESSDLNDGGAEPGPSFPTGQSDMSLKGSYQGPEMYTSNYYGRTDPGPSSQTDWYDSAQESYQGNELKVGYDVAGCAMNTAAFGNQFTDEADQVHFQCPDKMSESNDGSFNQLRSSHGFLQQDRALDHYLKDDRERKLLSGTTRYKEMQEFRKRLPAHDKKEELLQLINSEQVLVISGETGCGKTTQVAQFILDDAIEQGHGSLCRIICTQPRRISAISVAERVAAERDESCGGKSSVGFQIRLESKLPREQGSILYCTTGILLRWLVSDPLLIGTSHIILDEIHERDVLSDFLIIIVRDLLPKRPDFKLILMSATLNSQMFSAYFGNCKMCHIPGFTYPVQEFFLEEIIEKTGFSPRTITTLQNMDLEKIDLGLLVRVIKHISLQMEDGAILVFLPGWDDISKLHDNLKKETLFSTDKFLIIPLHSMMPSASQREVFDRPPKGVRKIIIATNIAETSITIDDVVFVVDAGKVKEKTYDVNNKIACLQPVWISKASSLQRRGGAGRVQPGYCFHLFTQHRAESLEDYQLPEMMRTPLEELCLQIKILKLGMIRPFLSKSLQPPEEQAVINALEVLRQLNALDGNEELTPLGYHLAALPVSPRIGKMILFGAIFSCLDPVLTIASVLGFKDPFVFPLGKQKEAEQARSKFAGDTRSDHLALLNAFQGWEQSVRNGRERDFCWRNFLSMNTMKMIKDMKKQFSGLLHEIGFLDSADPKAPAANRNSENLKLVKAVLCAGLYPNVASIQHHPSFKRPPKLRTQEDGLVYLHPKSVNVDVKVFEDNWLIYHEKMKSSSLFLYDSTMIAPFPLLFFGGDISVFMEEGYETVAVDDFIKFKSPTRIANLVKELRVELDKLLRQKIAHPKMKLSAGPGTGDKESALLRAIIDLITSEENTNWKKQKQLASDTRLRHY